MRRNIIIAICFFWMFIMINNIPNLSIPSVLLHIITYGPILFVLSFSRFQYLVQIKGVIFLAFFVYFFHYTLDRVYLFDIIELLIVPVILVLYRRFVRDDKYHLLLYTAVTIYLINCVVSLYEYNYKINLFYSELTYFDRFRSSGIWGHPLYNALIHGGCMLFIIMSSLNKYFKAILWFLGLYVIFCFDARAATIVTVGLSVGILYCRRVISKRNIIYIIAIGIIFAFILDKIGNTELGGKLFADETRSFDDGSSRVRIVTIEAFLKQPFDSIMMGVDDQFTLANRYGIVCFENSFIALVLRYGLLLAALIIYILARYTFKLTDRLQIRERLIVVCYIFLSGITSMALTSGYVWICYFSFYLMFCGASNLASDAKMER